MVEEIRSSATSSTTTQHSVRDINLEIEAWSEIVKQTLNSYNWMTKIKILVNWEEREIYLDNENFKVDSSNWQIMTVDKPDWNWFMNIKVNPERDIVEYLEWEYAWQQLFEWIWVVEREAKKIWKRLPFSHDENNEFQWIIDNNWEWEFRKTFPWIYRTNGTFWLVGQHSSFWTASDNNWEAYAMIFDKDGKFWVRRSTKKGVFLSCRLVKD